MVFKIFCSIVDERIKLEGLTGSFEILPVTCFEDPKAAILTVKMLKGSRR
jgi:hypothetical protein